MPFHWKRFGKAVKRKREADALTLREWGRKVKMHAATVCRIEQGKSCTLATALKICKSAGMDIWEFWRP